MNPLCKNRGQFNKYLTSVKENRASQAKKMGEQVSRQRSGGYRTCHLSYGPHNAMEWLSGLSSANARS
jgi:hypothetical protein